jgi:hypothetical protein
MTLQHLAHFQDLSVHIFAMHLDLQSSTHPYYPQNFSGDFRAMSTNHNTFSHFLCSLSNDCASN